MKTDINEVRIAGTVASSHFGQIAGRGYARMVIATKWTYEGPNGVTVADITEHVVTAFENSRIQDLDKIETGTRVEVVGRIQSQRYTNKDGDGVMTYGILASSVRVIND